MKRSNRKGCDYFASLVMTVNIFVDLLISTFVDTPLGCGETSLGDGNRHPKLWKQEKYDVMFVVVHLK
ncbi:MAG: hypothetical protein AAFQ91_14920 [Cyanobacteria bacterium J06621_15]